MNLETRLSQRMEQRMALLPQMLQSIEVLQLATAELLAHIEDELAQNETLEAAPAIETAVPPPMPPPMPGREDGFEDFPRRGSDEADSKLALLHNVPDRPDTLLEFVRMQLAWRGVEEPLHGAVVLLAQHLDTRGLLPFSTAELAAQNGADPELLTAALAVLHTLEPAGLGAHTPIEAMLLQLAGDPDRADIERLLTEHLEALARNKIPEVAKAMGLTVDEVQELMARIRLLNARPAAAFNVDVAEVIRPDAFAWLQDGEVRVAIADGTVPELSINADYEGMLHDRGMPREVRDYLRAKVRSAKDLIFAVHQRKATLQRVVAALMAHQRDFLATGRTGTKPLKMADLASSLGLHTSTVSRAIAGKYVQTERGIFLLRDFFDGARTSESQTGHGRLAVRETIGELVAAEDKSMPWSDDDLVQQLLQRGIQVARRTVTKYRQELGIPSSFQRRRHGSSA
jgi:RNA polymerase sigma-54 factor